MPEVQDLFIYAAGLFIVWALKRVVNQLDRIEERVHDLEIADAEDRGRRQRTRRGDTELVSG